MTAPRSPAPLPLALSVGCPSGIGPEVAIKALARFVRPVALVGDRAQLRALARRLGVSLRGHAVHSPGPPLAAADRVPGAPTRAGGAAQLLWVDAACDLVVSGLARAMVTGPVSKEAIATSGAPMAGEFRGHTEHLQRRLGAPEVVMAFWSKGLSTSLVTTHLALADVPSAISAEAVAGAALWLGRLLTSLSPRRGVKVVVAGLNPHAGEGGLLGSEEQKSIGPGVALARQRAAREGLLASFYGPMGAESAYRLAKDGVFDGVVAMYHDQATIPMKLLGFGDAVNVSLGLPIVRTSVDHGTAYDRAGHGSADASAMVQALRLADRLSTAKRATPMSGRGARRRAP